MTHIKEVKIKSLAQYVNVLTVLIWRKLLRTLYAKSRNNRMSSSHNIQENIGQDTCMGNVAVSKDLNKL